LSPFGYGEEFIRLNKELLDAYSSCSNMEEVIAAMNQYLAALEEAKRAKAARLIQEETKNNSSSSKISTSYLSRDDLPPSDSDDDYEYEYEDEEAQGEEGAQGEVSNEEA
jgi:pre-rRNA-processing protein TSR3